MTENKRGSLFLNHQFFLFFISQTFSSCGAFIQVIATAELLVKYTNSGLITGFSMVCAPLPGIILSLFSGSIGDRMQVKKLLTFFDVLRGLLVIQYIFCRSALSVFIIMLLVDMLDVLYSPSKNKLLTSILSKDDLLRGNSILNGGYGVISIITPVMAGVLINAFGVQSAFIVDSFLYIFSSILLSKISVTTKKGNDVYKRSKEIIHGIKYCLGLQTLRRVISTLAVIDFGMICVNIAFYSLAFDYLKVTSRCWGLFLSVLYGMNFFSMLLLIRYKKWFEKHPIIIANLLTVVSLVWCLYSMTDNLIYILLGVAFEGLSLSICNTLLITKILETAKKEYIARVMGIRDLVSNFAKLMGIGLTYLSLKFFRPNFIFVISAFILFIYTIFRAGSLKTE
jgi:hypothetical protein